MVYRNTYRELNEEVDSLKKKMKTLEEINKDLSSKIDEMLYDNQRMNKFPPNYNSRESMCVELDEVLTIKKCKICSKTFLQNHKLGRHLKKPDEAQKFRCEGE